MQPAMLALVIHRGATFRARLRVMQPSFEYRPITSIAAVAPVQLTVDHGLPTDWPIWIDGVRQMTALNRAAPQQPPHIARVVDASTLEINPLSAVGLIPQGGQIQYHPPLPLVGATAELTLYTKGQATSTLPVTVDAGGWVDVLLTDEQTAALDWAAQEYTLDVTLGGDVIRAYTGTITTVAAGAVAPGTCQGFAVIGADRGPPGPTITSAEFDTEGRLVITLEDGTQLMTEPLNRPFESIIGDPMANEALAELFNAKVDGEDFDAFLTAVNNALGEREFTLVAGANITIDRTNPEAPVINASGGGEVESVNGRTGLVVVTAEDVGLENADNTSDIDKPVSTAQQLALDAVAAAKVDKVAGKQLSTEDYTSAEKAKLGGVATGATANSTDAQLRDRATHTGTQASSTIGDFEAAAAAAAPVQDDDARLTDAREWTAAEVSQAEAGTGTATTARKWNALRVRQAVVAWWNSISSAFGRSFVASADAAAGRNALGLGTLATQNASGVSLSGNGAVLNIARANQTLGSIIRVTKNSDVDSFFAIETGTSGTDLLPVFRAKSARVTTPALFLIGDCFSTGDTGSVAMVRISGRTEDGLVAVRPLLDISNENTVRITVAADGSLRSVAPIRAGAFTVATLPATTDTGATAYATNGRKAGEGAGAGTGVPVYFQGGWKSYYDNTAVQA